MAVQQADELAEISCKSSFSFYALPLSAQNVMYEKPQSSGFRVWHTFVLMFGTLLMNIKNSPVLP